MVGVGVVELQGKGWNIEHEASLVALGLVKEGEKEEGEGVLLQEEG